MHCIIFHLQDQINRIIMEFKYFMDGEEKRMGIKINRIIMEFKSVICDEGYTTEGQINRIIMEFKYD